MLYRSKKDWWLVSLVTAAMLLPFVLAIYNFMSGNSQGASWYMLLVGTVTGAVVRWLTYPLDYEITSSELKVRCGILIRQRISLTAIDEVLPTRNA